MKSYPGFFRDYNINYKNPIIKQPVFHGSSIRDPVFFVDRGSFGGENLVDNLWIEAETTTYWMALFANRPHSLQEAVFWSLNHLLFEKTFQKRGFFVFLLMSSMKRVQKSGGFF